MICQKCGNANDDNSRFCTICGNDMFANNVANNIGQQYDYNQSAQYNQYGTALQVNQYGNNQYESSQYVDNQYANYQQYNYQQQGQMMQQPGYPMMQNAYPGYSGQYGNGQQMMDINQFAKLPQVKQASTNVLVGAICIYICAFISLVLNVFVNENIFAIIDIALMIGLALGVQFARSRVCAILLLIYSLINMIISIAVLGTLGGWLIFAAAIDAVIGTVKFQSLWENYKRTGMVY